MGLDIEVADGVPNPPLSHVERMLTPGAQMSTHDSYLAPARGHVVLVGRADRQDDVCSRPARACDIVQASLPLLPAATA